MMESRSQQNQPSIKRQRANPKFSRCQRHNPSTITEPPFISSTSCQRPSREIHGESSHVRSIVYETVKGETYMIRNGANAHVSTEQQLFTIKFFAYLSFKSRRKRRTGLRKRGQPQTICRFMQMKYFALASVSRKSYVKFT